MSNARRARNTTGVGDWSTYKLVSGDDDNDSDRESQKPGVTWQEFGMDFLSNMWFQSLMAILIIANAAVIGLETDRPAMACWNCFEQAFLVVFFFEVVLRLIVFTPGEFFSWNSADFKWNWFDFIVVFLGVTDTLFQFVVGAKGGGNATSAFRIIRLLRILRIFRIVRFLKQLYLLAYGLALAAVAVFWVTVLMGTGLYVSSVVLVRTLGQIQEDDPHHDFVISKFGSILRSMFTLFELMVNPYLEPYAEIMSEHVLLAVFIISFVLFGSFGMVALLTGVIHESMFEKNQLRQEEERTERENLRRDLVVRCGEFFGEMELNALGEATREDLLGRLYMIEDMFKSQGFSFQFQELEAMIDFMDVDQSGSISKKEFVDVVIQIAEGVNPMFMELRYVSSYVRAQMIKCEAAMQTISSTNSQLVSQVATHAKVSEEAFNSIKAQSQETAATQAVIQEYLEDLGIYKALGQAPTTRNSQTSVNRGLSAANLAVVETKGLRAEMQELKEFMMSVRDDIRDVSTAQQEILQKPPASSVSRLLQRGSSWSNRNPPPGITPGDVSPPKPQAKASQQGGAPPRYGTPGIAENDDTDLNGANGSQNRLDAPGGKNVAEAMTSDTPSQHRGNQPRAPAEDVWNYESWSPENET